MSLIIICEGKPRKKVCVKPDTSQLFSLVVWQVMNLKRTFLIKLQKAQLTVNYIIKDRAS